MALQYHVQCTGKKKILHVEEKQQIPSAIIKEFALNQESELSLQYFDGGWDDWVDVDNLAHLPERAKLQATVAITLYNDVTMDNTASLSSSVDQSSDPVSIESTPSSSTHSDQSGSRWPTPFPIKETMFRKFVWEKLTRKVPLNQVERGYVLDGLYEECVRYSILFHIFQDGLSSDDALMPNSVWLFYYYTTT
ncbi:hypothetical protein Pcinc_005530 [Petrolisthes cinctipes]|uniref:Uncharacterized protein n=1 Tax=Petrolisthes cinctipes TaxID=88211 RepID=A0AAE1KZ21_PETCI|nr:hypothetical protein Pcinc_005530 [Petrolisthes cinctipes]